MKYQLVLQFPGKNESDFDKLIELENELEENLGRTGEVDGHDFGSDEMNIFILTNEPSKAFTLIKQLLKDNRLFKNMKAAFRESKGNVYNILWPEDLDKFSVK